MRVLEEDIKDLRRAACAVTEKQFKLQTATLSNFIRIETMALAAADSAEFQANQSIFSPAYLAGSAAARRHVLAWHCLAVHAEGLSRVWSLSEANSRRAVELGLKLRKLLGFSNFLAEGDRGTTRFLPTAVVGILMHGEPSFFSFNEFVIRMRLALPHELALHAALQIGSQGQLDSSKHAFRSSGIESDVPFDFIRLPAAGTGASSVLYFQNGKLVAVTHPLSLNFAIRRLQHGAGYSNFLPEDINFLRPEVNENGKRQLKDIPLFHASKVIQRARVWQEMLGEHMTPAARIILNGKMTIPLTEYDIPAFERPNLPSCTDEGNEAFLDGIIAEYLVTQVISWCPPDRKPRCVSALSVVGKKTFPFRRMVLDLRGINAFTASWPSTLRGMASAAMLFTPGAVCWSIDVSSAYLVSQLAGCTGTQHPGVRADGTRTVHVGCTPQSCLGNCSKALLGLCWNDQYYVFNGNPFGAKISGNVLATLLEPLFRHIRSKGVRLLSWVDDLAMICVPTKEHEHDATGCGGIGPCTHCNHTHARALVLEKEINEEIAALGLIINEKSMAPTQVGTFLGIGFDTLRGTFWLSEEKADTLAEAAWELVDAGSASPRDLAKFRGRMTWYAPCVEGVALLTRAITRNIGAPEGNAAWDRRIPLTDEALSELRFWHSNLPNMAKHAKPMWRLSAEQATARFAAREAGVRAILETDASYLGWGAILRIMVDPARPELDEVHETSVAWGTEVPKDQPHREAMGALLAVKTFVSHITASTVVHQSDCACVVSAQTKGSAKSEVLQKTATELWKFCAVHGIQLLSGWVPGTYLLQTGCDTLSRDATTDPHNVMITDVVAADIVSWASKYTIEPSADWFASASTARCKTFATRQPEPGTAWVDALTVPSWRTVSCPSCKAPQHHDSWIFAPTPMIERSVEKAQCDGARGVMIVPVAPWAIWWPVLLNATLGSRRIEAEMPFEILCPVPHPSYATMRWTAVAFDFGKRALTQSRLCRCSQMQREIDMAERMRMVEQRARLAFLLAPHVPRPVPPHS